MIKILRIIALCGCVLVNYAPIKMKISDEQSQGQASQSQQSGQSNFDKIAERMNKEQALGRIVEKLETEEDILRLVETIKDEKMLLELKSAIEHNKDQAVIDSFRSKVKGKSSEIDKLLAGSEGFDVIDTNTGKVPDSGTDTNDESVYSSNAIVSETVADSKSDTSVTDSLESFFDEKNAKNSAEVLDFPKDFIDKLKAYLESGRTDLDGKIIKYVRDAELSSFMRLKAIVLDMGIDGKADLKFNELTSSA